MKVLVVGAAGKTGRLVIDRTIAAGHTVKALVHNPEEDTKHPFPAGVEVIHGDVRNPSRLTTAIEGCEAVIDVVGGKKPFLNTDLEASAAKVVLEVMQREGIKRLIVVSALGIGESKAQTTWFYENLLMPVFLRGIVKDKTDMEAEVSTTSLDWTLVRPPVLSDSEPTGSVKIVAEGEIAHKITRADLAQFLVDQLQSSAYLRRAVTITNS